ncbi:hypothetical protein AK88_02192 [Plasmodium fragile]|uniref:Homologous recombination OB-fold protein OB-fold domain-containing protein n=1 Tax=Plasmodium fragile TaxID=5857 RepID=A0A0D9QMD9_PLAFR|nr:uncharacterized protein AK88_02192 [Plasmodium fragile]KJP88078.1 hypothetical protein AK88_02192 [Plasmodium fragile]
MLDENLSCLLDESDDDCSRKNEDKKRKQQLRQKSSNVVNESDGEFLPKSILNFNIRNIENLDNFFKNTSGDFGTVAQHKGEIQRTASRTSTWLRPSGEANQRGNSLHRKNEQLRENSNSTNSVSGENRTIAVAKAAQVVDNDTSNDRNGRCGSHALNYFPPLEIEKQEIAKRKILEPSSQSTTNLVHAHGGQAKHDIKSNKVAEGNPDVVKYTIEANAAHWWESADVLEWESATPISSSTKLCGKKRASETNLYTELFKQGEPRHGDEAEAEVEIANSAAMQNEERILKKRNECVEGTDHANVPMHGEKNVNWSNGRSSNRVVRFVTNEDGQELPPQMRSNDTTKGTQIVNKAKWFSSRNSSTVPPMRTNSTTSISFLSGASKLNSIRYTSQMSDKCIEVDPLAEKNKIEKRKELIFCFSFIKYNSWVKALKILKLPLDPFHLSINAHRYVMDWGEEQTGQDRSQGQMRYASSPDSHEPSGAVGGAPSFLYTHNIHNILKNKRFANYRIEKMMVLVKSIRCRSHGYFIVAMDPSGQMPASIHKEVEKEYKKHISIGSTLILKDVTVFETLDNFPYLIITLRTLVRVIRAEETSYTEKEDILKNMYECTRRRA